MKQMRMVAVALTAVSLLGISSISSPASAEVAPTAAVGAVVLDPSAITSTRFVRSMRTVSQAAAIAAYGKAAADTAEMAADASVATVTATFALRCQEITGTVIGYGALVEQFRFSQVATWCFDGSTTSNRSSYYQIGCCAIQWRWDTIIASDNTVLPGSVWRRFRQGHFCHDLNPLPWGSQCIESKSPWVRQYMYPSGAYSQAGGF